MSLKNFITTIAIHTTVITGFHIAILVQSFLMLHLVHTGQLELLNFNLRQLNKTLSTTRPIENFEIENEVPQSVLERGEYFLRINWIMSTVSNLDVKAELDRGTNEFERPVAKYLGCNTTGVPPMHVAVRPLETAGSRKQEAEKKLRVCAQHQQSILRLLNKFQTAFDPILLNQFAMTLTPTILSVILLTSVTEFDVQIVLYSVPLLGCLFNLWVYCWLEERVTTESERIQEAVFDSDWLESSTDGFKRSMRIMISRSNQPLVVRIAGFIPLSAASFYSVVKLSFSYYNALAELRKSV